MKIFPIFVVLSVVGSEKSINNTSFTLYEVYPFNTEQLRQLKFFGAFCHALFANPVIFGILKNSLQILVPKMTEEIFGEFLMCRGMNFNVMINGSPSEHKLPHIKTAYNTNVQTGNINFEKYHRFDVIRSYLQKLARNHSNVVTLEKIGKSGEGRDLIATRISTGGNGTKPMIFIDGGIHANEWIGTAQALYIIQQLVENSGNSYLIKNVDWLVFPVVNPDGYEFSLSVASMFRKTRSKGINCIGVDINRNFDFFWGLKFGSSSGECSRIYRGPRPFSEPESRAVRDTILKYSNKIKLYLSFHSFSQLILYPWSHTTKSPLNANELLYLGKRVASAIEKVAGAHYDVGQIPHLLYPASGDSVSWAKGVAGISLAYAIELPPRKPNVYLPLSCIKFAVLEMFQGIKIFHEHIENYYSNKYLS